MLQGKIALITGAAQGIGRGHALTMGAQGATVALADINEDGARAVAAEIAAKGGKAIAIGMDVTNEASVRNGFKAAQSALGEIGVLVNNAGGVVVAPQPSESFSLEQWNRVIGLNLTGTWLCCREMIPQMKAAKRGRIISTASTTTDKGQPLGMSAYIAAKGGVVTLTRALARELGPYNITVNAVAPGLIPPKSTEGRAVGSDGLEAITRMVVGQQCLQRTGEVEDLANIVAFLASDAASFITGQVLNIDGGWTHG